MPLRPYLAPLKIARAAIRYQEELAYESAYADARAHAALDAGGIPDLENELYMACLKGARLILIDNDWAACEIDGVRAAPASPQAYSGYEWVCPGRHVLTMRTASAPRVHHFMLYPGEVLVRRRNADGDWAPVDVAEEQRAFAARVETWPRGAGADYWQAVARIRINAGAAKSRRLVVEETCRRIDGLVARVLGGEEPQKLAKAVNEAAVGLIGVALRIEDIEELVRLTAFQAWELRSAQKLEHAATVCHLGLTVLPDDPTLGAVLAAILADQGAGTDALALLDRVAKRPTGLSPQGEALAKTTRARLGGSTDTPFR